MYAVSHFPHLKEALRIAVTTGEWHWASAAISYGDR